MIARHELDLLAAHAVSPAVTDVADEHLALARAEQAADDRRAHALAFARARAALDDLPVGNANTAEQPVLFVREPRVERERPGKTLVRRRAEEVHDRLRGKPARDVA